MGEKSTEDIRCAVMHGMYDPYAEGVAFDRWLKQIKAEVWDEAAEWVADPHVARGLRQASPYREQEKFLKDLRD